MAATPDFLKPSINNPIDTDLDQIRDNFNYLLTVCATGSLVLPGWQTEVDISARSDYATPDALIFSRGTRRITINYE